MKGVVPSTALSYQKSVMVFVGKVVTETFCLNAGHLTELSVLQKNTLVICQYQLGLVSRGLKIRNVHISEWKTIYMGFDVTRSKLFSSPTPQPFSQDSNFLA